MQTFGVKDKANACQELMAQAGVAAAQPVCIGDDSIDLPTWPYVACLLPWRTLPHTSRLPPLEFWQRAAATELFVN